MVSSRWQKQHIYFQQIIWGVSAIISLLVIILMVSLGFGIGVAGVFFILVFAILRVSLAYAFKNRYGNSMVRVLHVDYEKSERDFRLMFKDKHIRFFRKSEDEAYRYEFPGYRLTMTVQPHWLYKELTAPPVAKVTLHEVTAKNEAFAQKLANSIDEMVELRSNGREKPKYA